MLDYDILLLKAQKEYSTLPQHLIPYVNANLNVNSVKHNLYETDKGLKFIFQFMQIKKKGNCCCMQK